MDIKWIFYGLFFYRNIINLTIQDVLKALKAKNVKDNGIDNNDIINDVILKVKIIYLYHCDKFAYIIKIILVDWVYKLGP